jgi:hypothetical protein
VTGVEFLKNRGNLYALAGGVALLCFLIALSTGMLTPVLRLFGLNIVTSARGVYADCSKPENKDIPYCQPREGKAARQWKNLSHGNKSQFSLHGS